MIRERLRAAAWWLVVALAAPFALVATLLFEVADRLEAREDRP